VRRGPGRGAAMLLTSKAKGHPSAPGGGTLIPAVGPVVNEFRQTGALPSAKKPSHDKECCPAPAGSPAGRDGAGPLVGLLPTYFSSHAKNSWCHSREFCGRNTQWFSSGKYTSRVGTPLSLSVA